MLDDDPLLRSLDDDDVFERVATLEFERIGIGSRGECQRGQKGKPEAESSLYDSHRIFPVSLKVEGSQGRHSRSGGLRSAGAAST